MAYRDEVLADTPVDYYEMNTATGTDSGSGARTLTKSASGITTGAAGKVGSAWSFNGTTGMGTMPSWMGTKSNFTFEAWIKAPSGAGFANDYPTIVRRDGTDIVLLRVRGTANTVQPGQLEAYIAGTTLTSGTTRVDDGNWHHVAVTVAGTAAKLYVDGTQVASATTSKSSYVMGTGAAYVGGNSSLAAEFFSGVLDEVAIYDTALSPTRIAAHYTAGASTNVTLDVSTLTASAGVNSVTTEVNTLTTSLTSVADRLDSGAQTATALDINAHIGYINFAMSALDGATIVSATLALHQISSSTGTSTVSRVVGAWDESSVAGTTLDTSITATFANGAGDKTIDVKNLVQAIVDSGQFNGFGLTTSASGSTTIATRENSTTEWRPTLTVVYAAGPVFVDVATAGASAAVNSVTVELGASMDVATVVAAAQAADVTVEGNADTSVSTLTASVSAADVTVEVSTDPNAEINADTLLVNAVAWDVTIAGTTTVDTDTVAASAASEDATVDIRNHALIDLDSPRTFFTRIGLVGAGSENNTDPADDDFGPIIPTESEDAYWEAVMNAGPDIWYRFNITSGVLETPRAYRYYQPGQSAYDQPLSEREQFKGRHYNTVIGLNDGPNGRKNVHFNGTARFEQAETFSVAGEVTQPLGTLEFTMRTDKANQFLMRMDDKPPAGQTTDVLKDVYLENGKLAFKIYTPSGNTFKLSQTVLAKTNLADGEWHHIALVSDYNGYFNVYIDGRLDIRRSSPPVSFPDFIGGYLVASGLPWYAEGVPSDKWYVGDMTEVAYYHRALSQDEIFRLNDTMYGYDPVYADSARATAVANDATVETNIKRVLTVNLGGDATIWQKGAGQIDDAFGMNAVAFSGLAYAGTDLKHSVTTNGFQFFSVNAMFERTGVPWHDDVTDMPRLVDLNLDVNLEDYDILNFVGYPTSEEDWENLNFYYSEWANRFGGPTPVKQIEDMFVAAKQYAVDGGGLFISDPFTAQAIGMIDRFEFVDMLVNDENLAVAHDNGGSHDKHGAQISPWGYPLPKAAVTNPRVPPYQLQSGINYEDLKHYYSDEHSNTWQTVRTLVEGLTDIPGRILTDAVWAWPTDLGSNGDSFALKTEERPEGLAIGDTFKVHGTAGSGGGDWGKNNGISPSLTARVFGQVATPLSNLKAGEVVTTFAPTYWDDDTEKPNPYKDHVLSAVVRPGDVLDGQVIKGRIYMNFSEGYMEYAPTIWTTPVDQIPEDEDMPEVYYETAESREWSYSMWRGSWAGTGSGRGQTIQTETYLDSNGKTKTRDVATRSTDEITGLVYGHRWPVEYEELPQMAHRGLEWLGSDGDSDGNATVGLTTVEATAQVNAATVETQKSTDISVETVEALAEAWDDADTEGANATVNVFTVGATAQVGNMKEIVDLSTLTVTATAYDDADGILATADMVVLRLPTPGVILTLEDN